MGYVVIPVLSTRNFLTYCLEWKWHISTDNLSHQENDDEWLAILEHYGSTPSQLVRRIDLRNSVGRPRDRPACESSLVRPALDLGAKFASGIADPCLGLHHSPYGSALDLELFLGHAPTFAGICRPRRLDCPCCVKLFESIALDLKMPTWLGNKSGKDPLPFYPPNDPFPGWLPCLSRGRAKRER